LILSVLIGTFYSAEIVKSASESSISEASQHSLESSKSAGAKADLEGEPRKSSISGAKSLHEMKSATVEGESSSCDPKSNEGKNVHMIVYLKLTFYDYLDEYSIRPSKSDTSLTDGFVLIDNDRHKGDQILRKGKLI